MRNKIIFTLLAVITITLVTSIPDIDAGRAHNEFLRYGTSLGFSALQDYHDHPHDRII